MSNFVFHRRVWATKDAAETAKASRRKTIFLRIRAPRGGLPGISEWAFCFTHRTLPLPSTQHMYQQSEPQRDQGGPMARSTRLTGPISRAKSPSRNVGFRGPTNPAHSEILESDLFII